MEEGMGSEGTNIPSKPSRRGASYHQVDPVANVADATREVPCALQHHSSSPQLSVTEKEPTLEGNTESFNYDIDVSKFSDAQYCYYLLEAMPLPGPTWSTTDPCVLAEPPSSAPPFEASMGLEWGENQNSSYSWWMGFLDGLDGNMTNEEILDHPFVEKNIVMENSKGLSYESQPFVDAIDLSCCCPDDWLMVPTMEKELGDVVMP